MSHHGPTVVHVCHGCHVEFATYADRLPKGWILVGGLPYCKRCQRRRKK